MKPSISPATTKRQEAPSASSTAGRAAAVSAAPLVCRPGRSKASPRRSPAPAAVQITVSSITPWGTISAQNWRSSPAAWLALASTPSWKPLTKSSSTVGSPASSPSTQARAATRMLFWMMKAES